MDKISVEEYWEKMKQNAQQGTIVIQEEEGEILLDMKGKCLAIYTTPENFKRIFKKR